MSTPRADRVDHRKPGSPTPHQVSGAGRRGSSATAARQRRQGLFPPVSPTEQAPNGVTIESDLDQASRPLGPEGLASRRPELLAEQATGPPLWWQPRGPGPPISSVLDAGLDHLGLRGRGSRQHTSKTIWMSAPSASWTWTADSRRHAVSGIRRSCERKVTPVVVDRGSEGEHLEAARIREHVSGPAGEPVEPSEVLDHARRPGRSMR